MSMTVGKRKPLTQSELIIQCWAELNAKSVGADELETIGRVLLERFGEGAFGPAAIARVLADEDLPLRHPEVLDCDTVWRERRTDSFTGETFDFATLEKAITTVEALGRLAGNLQKADTKRWAALRSTVLRVQQDLELIGHSAVGNREVRAVAAEASTWLTVWLQNPSVFEEWLALRRLSPEFVQKFSQ